VDKSSVDHSVSGSCTAAKAFEIFQRAAMFVGSGRDEVFGCRVRTRKTEHLMTASISSRTMAEPIKPVAPVRKTRSFLSPKQFVVRSMGTKRALDLRAGPKPSQ
jgi:hypothetical protein